MSQVQVGCPRLQLTHNTNLSTGLPDTIRVFASTWLEIGYTTWCMHVSAAAAAVAASNARVVNAVAVKALVLIAMLYIRVAQACGADLSSKYMRHGNANAHATHTHTPSHLCMGVGMGEGEDATKCSHMTCTLTVLNTVLQQMLPFASVATRAGQHCVGV